MGVTFPKWLWDVYKRACAKKAKREEEGKNSHTAGDLQDIVVEGVKARGAAKKGRRWPQVKAESRLELLE